MKVKKLESDTIFRITSKSDTFPKIIFHFFVVFRITRSLVDFFGENSSDKTRGEKNLSHHYKMWFLWI